MRQMLLQEDIDAMLALPHIIAVNDEASNRVASSPTSCTCRDSTRSSCVSSPPAAGSLDTSALRSLPSLTDLKAALKQSLLPAVAACRHLVQLRVPSADFGEGDFRRFFTSPNMVRLQRLELCYFLSDQPLPAEEFTDAFAAMTQLRHVELEFLGIFDRLLSGMVVRLPHEASEFVSDPGPFLTRSPAARGVSSCASGASSSVV